ncbi:MAG TPA: hypothetical protein VIB60_03235 [Methylomirabilota bacterium]
MSRIAVASGLGRFALGLRRFCRTPLTVEAARQAVLQRMATRDQAFLALLERAVYANPRSPYRALLRAAGCEAGDVRALVAREGVEGALQHLRAAGVYVRFEELKGLEPAVRGGQTFHFRPDDFDNPLVRPNIPSRSGGTRAQPARILIDLDEIEMMAANWTLWFEAHGWDRRPIVFATPEYPGIVSRQLLCAKRGTPYARWFATGRGGSLAYRGVSAAVHWLARRATGTPRPERVPLADAWRIGEELARMAETGLPPCVISSPSTAARVCLAMDERGQRLPGVAFVLGGEPFTEARKQTLGAVGAVGVPSFGMSEAGAVGAQCPQPAAVDDVHLYLDGVAMVTDPRTLRDGRTVDALLLTSLRPAARKMLLNTEIGDYGRLESRRCECTFDALGYHARLSGIRSFQKLTGEGMTILGSDLYPVLEDVLPRRFGGAVGDYQLVERQDERGLPRYQLLVSPRVGRIDDGAMIRLLLDELRPIRPPYRFMLDQWSQAGVLEVRREQPIASDRGKVPPFRALGAPEPGRVP